MHIGSIQVPIPYPRALIWLICTFCSISSAIHKNIQAGSHLISHPSKYTTNHVEGLILFPWLSEDIRESTIKSQEIIPFNEAYDTHDFKAHLRAP
jgi:hypothetical protein